MSEIKNENKFFESYDYFKKISGELGIKETQIRSAIELATEGNTLPFIARYRKEQTGNLDETQLKDIFDRYEYLRNLMQRKDDVIRSITEQEKMTDELFKKIVAADKMQILEDLYLPYKPKKRTRGTIARELGLEPLSLLISEQKTESGKPEEYAAAYVDAAKGINTPEDALSYAMDIIAENVSENAEFRNAVREFYKRGGILQSAKKEKRASKKAAEKDDEAVEAAVKTDMFKGKKASADDFANYFDHKELMSKMPPHRVLAINRGEAEGFLAVKITLEKEDELAEMGNKKFVTNTRSVFTKNYSASVADGLKRLIIPSITNEIRNDMTAVAEAHAIKIFSRNMDALLMQPPISNKVVMGVDPGFRAGTKISVIDASGKFLEYATIYPNQPQNDVEKAKKVVSALIKKHKVELIAIGNGTASRETESFIASIIREEKLGVKYAIVSEAGASIYSASKIAAYEFPDLDVLARGAISIARRVLDPLSELVKIDPKSIGVGEYQHDVNQKELAGSLGFVVTSCVNRVGVNLNTASFAILKYISGLNETQAVSIVKFRDENGKFASRGELKKVPKVGAKTFEQAAGFLKVPESKNPLDNTWVHPESYSVASKIIEMKGLKLTELNGPEGLLKLRTAFSAVDAPWMDKAAADLSISGQLLADIVEALKKPGLDPREELPPILLKSDVLSIGDIKTGMKLMGTVRNVVDFGAFVDIGVKNDGLCHISHCADKYIKHPMEVLKIGDILEFTVISVDMDRGRVSLSLKTNPFEDFTGNAARGGAAGDRHQSNGPRAGRTPAANDRPAPVQKKGPVTLDNLSERYEDRMKDNFTSSQIIFKPLKK